MGIGRPRSVTACGEEVNKEDPALLAKQEALYNLFGKYDPSNIYNMDKTSLFYRMLPRYGLIEQSEDSKNQIERVTLVVCGNIKGFHKLPLMMIRKYNNSDYTN